MNLSPIEEYVYYHCSPKCECSKRAATRIEDTAAQAIEIIRSLRFDPNQHPGVFDVPRDFETPDQIRAGEPVPSFPAALVYTGRAHSACAIVFGQD